MTGFRERFVTLCDDHKDRIGQRFQVVEVLKDAGQNIGPAGEVTGRFDMYLIRFEDGTEIEAWGEEVKKSAGIRSWGR